MTRRFVSNLLVVLALASAPVLASAQQPVDRRSPASALADLPERASAAGWADVDALRALPWFDEVVRNQLRELDVSPRSATQALTMLSHTHAAHASLVRGAGDTALFATAVLHGEYVRNEVPNAVLGLMPGLLAGLWQATTIDGRRAYDMGVAVLIELTPNDWLLARRLRGALPIPGATPSEDLRLLVEYGRSLGVAGAARSLAYGVLVGPESILPGSEPPTTLESIFHGPRRAMASFTAEGELLVVHWDVTLHHASDTDRWEAHYRSTIETLATRLGVPASSVRTTVTREDTRLTARIEVDRVAADAFVAQLVGRALPTAMTSGTTRPGATP